jgi:CheY-like chemotaxis protein
MRRFILALLKCAGYPGLGASSVPEALNCVTAAPNAFSLILVAHQPPRVDGFALLRRLRAQGFQGHILLRPTIEPQADAAPNARSAGTTFS